MIKKSYFQDNNFSLLLGDSFKVLKKIEPKSIDVIFADPPYFISGGGVSCQWKTSISK